MKSAVRIHHSQSKVAGQQLSLSLSPLKTPAQLADGKAPWPEEAKIARIKAMAAAIVAARLGSASKAPDRPPALQKTLGEVAPVAAVAAPDLLAKAQAEHIASAGEVIHERVEAAAQADAMLYEAAKAAAAEEAKTTEAVAKAEPAKEECAKKAQALAEADNRRILFERAEAQALAEEVAKAAAAEVAKRTEEAAEDEAEAEAMAEAMREAAKAAAAERAGAEASEETTDAMAKAICACVDAEATMAEALIDAGSAATALGLAEAEAEPLDDKFAAALQSMRSNKGRDDRSVVRGAVIY